MSIQRNEQGHWLETRDRADYFVDMAAKIAGITREQCYSRLAAGDELQYDRPYEKLRDTAATKPAAAAATTAACKCKKCGTTGPRGQYPFSTLPGSGLCDDCI